MRSPQRKRLETAKLKALKAAAQRGFIDIEDGRFTDVTDDALDDFISALGRTAEMPVVKPDKK